MGLKARRRFRGGHQLQNTRMQCAAQLGVQLLVDRRVTTAGAGEICAKRAAKLWTQS